jgi:hypothetical protein
MGKLCKNILETLILMTCIGDFNFDDEDYLN